MNAPLPASPLSDSQLQTIEALAQQCDSTQLDWVQGYLAGYRAAQQAAGTTVVTVPNTQAATLTVLFGSQTGNAEELAHQLTQQARERKIQVKCLNMADYAERQLKKEQLLVVIASTQGEGEPPDNAMGLYEFLYSRKAPKLDGLKFAVLSLGDSSYEYFCKTGIDFDMRLAELGGERLLERVDCDLDYEDASEEWMTRLLGELAAKQPEEQSRLQIASVSSSTASRYDRKNPFQAPLLDRICLSGRGSTKAVYHMEFSLEDSGLVYTPGDSLGVHACNNPVLVSQLLDATQLDASTPVEIKNETLSLAEALQTRLEITRLTPPIIKQWAELSGSTELTRLDADRDALMAWLWGHDLLDLVQQHPVAGLQAQTLVDHLRRLPPRLYSIASSQAAVDEEVHITSALVRYNLEGRQREGIASTWLAERLDGEATAPVYIDVNKNFRLPEDPETAIIMIGPGTGVAPFRAFMQERQAGAHSGDNWLFFGDRNFRTDFLYQTEWLHWRKDGLLTRLDVAFSRDTERKIYVQHRIRQAGRDVWRWLEDGAYLYVCGDADAMAPDVHQALKDVIIEHGHKTSDQAEHYLRDLTQHKRYQRDVY